MAVMKVIILLHFQLTDKIVFGLRLFSQQFRHCRYYYYFI